MLSYDDPLVISYHFNQVDFGAAANITRLLAVPVLKNGRKPGGKVLGALLHNITEDLAGSTSDGFVEVGISGDTDKYFQSIALDETVDVGETLWLNNDTVNNTPVDIENGRTDITVTFVVTVGTPTGIADVTLLIKWF